MSNMHYLGNLFGHPDCQGSDDGEHWHIAVPLPFYYNRVLMAWNVLVGRAEAVRWPLPWEQEEVLRRFNEVKP